MISPKNQIKKLKAMNDQFNAYIEKTIQKAKELNQENTLLNNRRKDLEHLIKEQNNIIIFQQEEILKTGLNTFNNIITNEERALMTENMNLRNNYIDAVQKSNTIIIKYNALIDYMEVMKSELQRPKE